MAQRTITTRIALDGETEFKKQLSLVNSELKTLKSEMAYTEATFKGQANSMEALTEKDRLLREEIQLQEEKIKALETAVEDATEAYGDADKRTDGWRQSLLRAKTDLVKLNDELQDTDKYLDEARGSSDKCATSIDGFGKDVKDAGETGLQTLMSNLGKLKNMLVGGAVVTGLKEIAGAVLEVEESTREYRSITGTLEVSSQAAGYTAEETAATYERLYGVLGDAQTTATTVANLQAIRLSQEDLIAMTDMATGAWATYGDSIPIDGLAESINETIKAGQVTGTFADVLNWGSKENETFGVKMKQNIEFTELSKKELEKLTDAQRDEYEATKAQYDATEEWNQSVQEAKSAEDLFNLALKECQTESERTNLIMGAMSEQGLAETGKAWRDVNEDIVKANESQARMEEAMGKLGEALAPVADAIRNFGADCIEWLAGKITNAIDAFNDFWDAMTKGDLDNERAARWAASRGYTSTTKSSGLGTDSARNEKFNGSHADGLDYVPYDGYVAQLHKGEAVLTAQENQMLRALTGNLSGNRGVTAQDLQAVTAAAVNGLSTAMGGSGGRYRIEIPIVVNGQEFSRAIVPDLRAVMKSDPEVTDDK